MTTRKQTITVTCEVCGAKFETDPNDPAHKIDHSRGDAIPAVVDERGAVKPSAW